MNEAIEIVFGLLGGLAVFIFGMNMMSECLQKAAGEKMKTILSLLTKNPVLGVEEFPRLPNHEKICGNPIRRNGTKGTAKSPSSRNHRLYCIRLDRLLLKIRLAIKRIPMIPLIKTLHIKKRIIKLATLSAPFF